MKFTFEDAEEKKKDSDYQLQKSREEVDSQKSVIKALEKENEATKKQLKLQGIIYICTLHEDFCF